VSRRVRRLLLSLVAAGVGASLAFRAQDPAPRTLLTALELARTGPEHERLQRLAGAWDLVVRAPAAKEPEARESKGRVAGRTMLGGRYVVLTFDVPLGAGRLEGVQILGFDTLRRCYTSSWRDDLSTWSVECAGVPEPETPDTLRLRGTLADAASPAGRPFALELRFAAADRVEVVLSERRDDEDVVVQQQVWTRR
jgi:hypothetical protein